MKKKLLSFALALMMVLCLLPATALAADVTPDTSWYDKDGTEFVLYDAADLFGFAKLVNNGTTTFEGKTIKLGADIDLNGAKWKSIYGFKGEFDGCDHTIKNFKPYSTATRVGGFFATIEGGSVHDLTLDEVEATAGTNYYGTLAGYAQNVTVENVTVNHLNLQANADTKTSTAVWGGMFGYCGGSTAENCTVKNMTAVTSGDEYLIGGFAGWSLTGAKSNETCTCKNYVNCDVDGVQIEASGSGNVGGFVGLTGKRWNHPGYDSCDVTGIDFTVSGNLHVGGFAGYTKAPGTAVNCTTQGAIDASGVTDPGKYIGGFYGFATPEWQEYVGFWHVFRDCTTNVNITSGGATAGGFLGAVTGGLCHAVEFEDCEAKGNVINPTGIAGGFIGYDGGSPTRASVGSLPLDESAGTYTNCTASGTVFGAVAGGFIGKAEISGDSNLANNSKIHLIDCSFTGTVVGTEACDGLIGEVGSLENNGFHLEITTEDSTVNQAMVIWSANAVVSENGTILVPAGSTIIGEDGTKTTTTEDMTIDPNKTDETSSGIPGWLLTGLLGSSTLNEQTFVDVSRGAYYYNAVEWAQNKGIAGGVDSKHFAPDESCTRAQAVTMLWRAAGCPDIWGENPFVDVDASDYYYEAVLWAVAMGITSGTDETHFSPDEACTRGQIVTFLHRAARCYQAHENYGFVDVKNGSYCEDAVNWAVSCGITNGTGVDTFSPDDTCTRAQIVTFLYRNR